MYEIRPWLVRCSGHKHLEDDRSRVNAVCLGKRLFQGSNQDFREKSMFVNARGDVNVNYDDGEGQRVGLDEDKRAPP